MIQIITGDCLDVFRDARGLGALISDIPSRMAFMGRKWDTYPPDLTYTPPFPPRSKAHLRELQRERSFINVWAPRLAAGWDACADDAICFTWAIPKQCDATFQAMRLAGWDIKDAVAHLFGQGWPKSTSEFKPSWELWAYGTKGSPTLDIDAGRVKRGDAIQPFASPRKARGLMNSTDEPRELYEQNAGGSWPTNATMSHFDCCERIGERRVKGPGWSEKDRDTPVSTFFSPDAKRGSKAPMTYATDGTETIPAFRCACYCDCGATWTAPSGGAPPRCQCGRATQWACPVARLGEMSGERPTGIPTKGAARTTGAIYGDISERSTNGGGDSGDASRYFNTFEPFCYFAKANGRVDKATGIPGGERHAGCEELYWRANKKNSFGFDQVTREEWVTFGANVTASTYGSESVDGAASRRRKPRDTSTATARGNAHATVKSIKLMMHLIALSGATKIGDLCVGSGSTAIAVLLLNRRREALRQPPIEFIGAEICPEAVAITNARLKWWGNISDAALEAFVDDDEMPANVSVHPGQSAFSW